MDKDKAGTLLKKFGVALIGLTAIVAVPIFAFALLAIKANSATPTLIALPASTSTVLATTEPALTTLSATPTQPITTAPTATTPAFPGVLPTPATSHKSLGRSLGRVSLLMSEQEVLQWLGEPKVRTALHGNGSPEWDYDGLIVGGLPVWLLRVETPSKATTAEGFSLGQDKMAFKRIYDGFTINGYRVDDEDQFTVKDGFVTLNVSFDHNGKAIFVDLRCEWSNATNKFC